MYKKKDPFFVTGKIISENLSKVIYIVIFEQILQYQRLLIIALYFSSKKGSIKRSVFENNGVN